MNGGRCFALVLGAPAPSPALRRSGGAPVGTGGSAWVGAWLACHEGFVDMPGRLGRRGRRRSQLTALRGGSAWPIKDRSCAHFDARQRSRGDAPKRTTIASLQVSGIARPRRGYSRRTESLPLSACRHGYSGRDTRASRTRRSGQIQRSHAGHLRISRTGQSCSARPLALVPRPHADVVRRDAPSEQRVGRAVVVQEGGLDGPSEVRVREMTGAVLGILERRDPPWECDRSSLGRGADRGAVSLLRPVPDHGRRDGVSEPECDCLNLPCKLDMG